VSYTRRCCRYATRRWSSWPGCWPPNGRVRHHHRGVQEPKDGILTALQQQFNKAHNGVRAIGERGNALLKMTFKALCNVRLDPWRIGRIVAEALVILHFDHARTA
jgi:DDE superfamily endonuclease